MRQSFVFQQQQQQQVVVQENMSNLTSASCEAASVSSDNQQLQYFAPLQHPIKKKRNLPGNPDPGAEVIALSPKTLMATNRFVCEICNKGFQRDQNLQLHRRGHNLPWKLKQRSSKEVRKKVYVCPEASCVHHDPSRALGDLTGIKKHFCRKHGEKKWKCDKCSKKYAVQSDWKAHSKTCGTREYRCDCGTLFSRRDSFITHRAFCDALAEESAKGHHQIQPPPSHLLLSNNQIFQQQQPQLPDHHHHDVNQNLHASIFKKEQQNYSMIPPWLGGGGPPSTSILSSRADHQDHQHQDLMLTQLQGGQEDDMASPSNSHSHSHSPRVVGPTGLPAYQAAPSPHMSATALLQKAAQMGATMSTKNTTTAPVVGPHLQAQAHVSASFGLNLSSPHAGAFGNKPETQTQTPPFLQHNTVIINTSHHDHDHGFEQEQEQDPFAAIFNSPSKNKRDDQNPSTDHYQNGNNNSTQPFTQTPSRHTANGNGEGLTRDFLGLTPLSHSDILTMAGLDTTTHHLHHQTHKQPWQQQ